MGTTASYTFLKDGVGKSVFCSHDGMTQHLGTSLVKLICTATNEELEKIYNGLILYKYGDTVTPQIREIIELIQDKPHLLVGTPLRYGEDAGECECEYTYILDLDNYHFTAYHDDVQKMHFEFDDLRTLGTIMMCGE